MNKFLGLLRAVAFGLFPEELDEAAESRVAEINKLRRDRNDRGIPRRIGATICPHCGKRTSLESSYCQQCGFVPTGGFK